MALKALVAPSSPEAMHSIPPIPPPPAWPLNSLELPHDTYGLCLASQLYVPGQYCTALYSAHPRSPLGSESALLFLSSASISRFLASIPSESSVPVNASTLGILETAATSPWIRNHGVFDLIVDHEVTLLPICCVAGATSTGILHFVTEIHRHAE